MAQGRGKEKKTTTKKIIMTDKNYIGGSAKAIQSEYGEFFNISLKMEDLKAIVNEKGYVNLTMNKRKEVGQYGDTHSIIENTWKPEKQDKAPEQAKKELTVDDIPF